MAVSPDDADGDLAAEVAQAYSEGEVSVLGRIAQLLGMNIDSDSWSAQRRNGTGAVRRAVSSLLGRVFARGRRAADKSIEDAAKRGTASADKDLGDAAKGLPDPSGHRVKMAKQGLGKDLKAVEKAVNSQVLTAYQRIITEVTQAVTAGTNTRLVAAGRALARFADAGITGFVDSAGRNWEIATYVEMAVRTHSANAMIDAHLDRLASAGINLVQVSTGPYSCKLCDPWEGKILEVGGPKGKHTATVVFGGKKVKVAVDGSYEEARAAGLMHPNCFPADTLVSSRSPVRAADSRWYEGDLVVLRTASGKKLSVTPNHPILTPEGWVAAGLLTVGSNVLSYRDGVELVDVGVGPDDQLVPTEIGQVFETLKHSSAVTTVRVPAASEQFHGDGGQSDVEVVLTDGLLRPGVETEGAESVGNSQLSLRNPVPSDLTGSGSGFEFLDRPRSDASGTACRHGVPFLLSELGEPTPESFASAESWHVVPAEQSADGSLRDAELLADFTLGRLSALVHADSLVEVSRRPFAGHVYNLQTGDGWYAAESIITHNCKHNVTGYLPGASRAADKPDTKGVTYEDTQKQRALERAARRWDRRRAVALTPEEKAKADAKVKLYKAQIRDHVAKTGLPRKTNRERHDGTR